MKKRSRRHVLCFALILALAPSARARGAEDLAQRVDHLDVRVRYVDGQIFVAAMNRGEHRVLVGAEAARARKFELRGRYRAELREVGRAGGAVVRFDFPMLADADAGNAELVDDEIRKHTRSEAMVRLPLPPAGANAEVVISDEKTRRQLRVSVPSPLGAVPVPVAPVHMSAGPAPAPANTDVAAPAPLWHPADGARALLPHR